MSNSQGFFRACKTCLFCLLVALSPFAGAADDPVAQPTVLEKLDLNAADAATIAQVMDGVGMVKAREIVAYRDQYGKFTSIEQLLEVKGIGDATLDKNRDRIMVLPE